jgi:hypothetical protein
MRCVMLVGHGGFDKLELRDDIPVPRPGPGEVLIKVAAAGINNTDINTRIGWYSKTVRDANRGPQGDGDRRRQLDGRSARLSPHSGRGLLRADRGGR